MSLQTWQETLVSAQGDGTQILNSSTAASIIPASAKITLPNNWFNIGKALRLTLAGRITSVVTTPGTLILDFRLGAVIAWTSQAMPLNTVAKTDLPWYLQAIFTCRSIGASTTATLMGQGFFISEDYVGVALPATGSAGVVLANNATAPAPGTGFDSTAALTVDVYGKFSVATATTALTLHQYVLEALN
jgi:hypothetical protein